MREINHRMNRQRVACAHGGFELAEQVCDGVGVVADQFASAGEHDVAGSLAQYHATESKKLVRAVERVGDCLGCIEHLPVAMQE
jgi:hypothetical protein